MVCQVVTDGPGVVCNPLRDTRNLAPCLHEEADTCITAHVSDAFNRAYSTIMIRMVDTDRVVLSIATVRKLGECEIWLAFGTGDHFRCITAHDIATSLGQQRSLALPIFHVFTGCDTLSLY